MKRGQLEHIIRACCAITGQSEIIIIGSQSILSQFPNAPQALLASMEADVFPRHRPDLAINIDGAIGERSMFHETFGYWAHGVGEETVTLPARWRERSIHNENTGGGTGLCLEAQDLAASKLAGEGERPLLRKRNAENTRGRPARTRQSHRRHAITPGEKDIAGCAVTAPLRRQSRRNVALARG
jgi:hypothetical protein